MTLRGRINTLTNLKPYLLLASILSEAARFLQYFCEIFLLIKKEPRPADSSSGSLYFKDSYATDPDSGPNPDSVLHPDPCQNSKSCDQADQPGTKPIEPKSAGIFGS